MRTKTCEVIRKNQVYGRKIQDLTGRIQGVSANMLEERHEVSCPAGKFYPSNGNQDSFHESHKFVCYF